MTDRMPPAPASSGIQMTSFTLSEREFESIRKLVKEKTGISLGLHKRDLVVSRLARRLRSLGLTSFKDYLQVLHSPEGADELVQMINRITTNKTDFFRENHHFEYLTQKLLPELVAQGERSGQRRLRCWSAGCSSGEEPYTLAMTFAEFFREHRGWDVKILATDLDTSMLAKASAGEYEESLLAPVPRGMLARYFQRRRGEEGNLFVVRPELRAMITFRKFNLMQPRYPIKVPLDMVFCRNVLIYFDLDDKVDILTKFHAVIKPEGHIFVGHSESLMMVKDLFRYQATTIYRKI